MSNVSMCDKPQNIVLLRVVHPISIEAEAWQTKIFPVQVSAEYICRITSAKTLFDLLVFVPVLLFE